MDLTSVFSAIAAADDAQLTLIQRAVTSRRESLHDSAVLANLATISVGDKVKTNDNVRPRYYASQPAVITKVTSGKYPFELRFLNPVHNTNGVLITTVKFTGAAVTKVSA